MTTASDVICSRCLRPSPIGRVHVCGERRAERRRETLSRVQPVAVQFHKGIRCDEASRGKLCAHCAQPMHLGQHLAASGWRHYACEPPQR